MVEPSHWNFADFWEMVAEELPGAPAQRQGERVFTWAEFDRRADGLAAALLDGRAARDDRVALCLRNSPEYLEVMFAATKIGIPAVNTNYRYRRDELLYLWRNADITAVVFHGAFTEQVGEVRAELPAVRSWIHVDDGTAVCPAWAIPYEQAAGSAAGQTRSRWGRSGEDLFLLYTGGTTGMPKGVMWRQYDIFMQLNSVGPPSYPIEDGIPGMRRFITEPGRTHVSASPMMHGTGLFGGYLTLNDGGCVISLRGHGFDPVELLDTVHGLRVRSLAMVGDAFGRPILETMAREPGRWDISCLGNLLSSGAFLSDAVKAGLLEQCPSLTIVDGFSSSEGFGMGWSISTKDDVATTARFEIGPHAAVLDDELRPVTPGSGVVGRLAVGNRVPLGYYKDEEKSAATFVTVDGVRMALPGDRAIVEADGRIQLLGRDSLCINSAGEKIYTEEVEAVLLGHPDVADALVVGVPDPQ
ncbi:AMP-binding protein [Nocardia aurantia]|uniref:Long-chain-fatty-acid--CoA/3-oxocholest-4-en-26-oate--CoA ligase n=1 Tax=Nocardia aurantia TaxID=2585199 RepID=A0A7K0DTV8_9NOCA|nr:AMP-binding protein [Nocardia aurantia]MQY29205.1 Long-chain-fatty-acid--CoA/3-oxocholest-4-en-26-oate--CoA ligase [Nocardia aurantia]